MVPIFYFLCKLKVKLFTKSEGQILELESFEKKKKNKLWFVLFVFFF